MAFFAAPGCPPMPVTISLLFQSGKHFLHRFLIGQRIRQELIFPVLVFAVRDTYRFPIDADEPRP